MKTLDLVRPLEAEWQGVVDAVLRARGSALTSDVARLGPKVAEASRLYNAGLATSTQRAPLDARVGFSFARDVPKGAAAVRELVLAGLLRGEEHDASRPLRIVDLGAGLGAMSWGIARAASARHVRALLVDDDADALATAASVAREARARLAGAPAAIAPSLEVSTRTSPLAPGMSLPEADVVVLGQVLSELDRDLDEASRVAKHAALLEDLLDRVVAQTGSLVVVEPALRDRSRHLHAVRDVLASRSRTVFAPCLHAAPCPALAAPGEWCHDDLAVDLPPWLAPLARAAGLRWQGLTFSHLVLRRDDRTLRDASLRAPSRGDGRERLHLRVISDRMVTKGKVELFACTADARRLRLRRLDRDAPRRGEVDAWAELRRGDVVTMDAPDERGRVGFEAAIDVWPVGK